MNTNKNKCCGNTFKHIDDKERGKEGRYNKKQIDYFILFTEQELTDITCVNDDDDNDL